jgi:hypothetical protein
LQKSEFFAEFEDVALRYQVAPETKPSAPFPLPLHQAAEALPLADHAFAYDAPVPTPDLKRFSSQDHCKSIANAQFSITKNESLILEFSFGDSRNAKSLDVDLTVTRRNSPAVLASRRAYWPPSACVNG